ncbi:MAG: hypothetical protein KGY41_01840 [Desulfovermiculus sp.]|nr:hypothetical protein [Desulfovermiculus sp.]
MVVHNGRNILFIIILTVFFADAAIGLADSLDLQQYKNYTGNEDISGWYMSEKLDGIRGYWDGENLLTRSGRTIHAPGWFTHDFPGIGSQVRFKHYGWTRHDNPRFASFLQVINHPEMSNP